MTTSEAKFWKTFAKIAGRFRVLFNGMIRARGVCPVCAVANEIRNENKWKVEISLAASEIGLPYSFASDVGSAADFSRPRSTSKIREKMLTMMEAARVA